MTFHLLPLARRTLHGHFSKDLPPVLTIHSGDTVHLQSLSAAWHLIESADAFERAPKFQPREAGKDDGHALSGPIAIDGAKAGMVVEVRLKKIRTAQHGWSEAGGFASDWNKKLGIAEPPSQLTLWKLDPDLNVATAKNGLQIPMHPFLGVIGMPPHEEGILSTRPPRFCGGNMDCKLLVEGSRLFLPIAVDGALISLGDGHAVQGDGEVSGVAIECPLERVEVEFHLHENLSLTMPRAETPSGWVTLGFHQDLNEAWVLAMDGMLNLMGELYGFERKEAMNLASLVVDLHITQVVNEVQGVHAVLPHGVIIQKA